MLNIPSTITDPSYRYKMPRLQTKTECRGNGIKTAFGNVVEVARALKIPPIYLVKYFGYELGAITKYDEKDNEGVRAIVMGNHDNGQMQKMLDKFIEMFILCPTCHLPEIDITIKKGDIHGLCMACGFNGPLNDAIEHKLAQFVTKNPPHEYGKEKDDGGAKKKDKATRQREKAEKARQAAAERDQSDDDEENEDGNTGKARKAKKDKKDKKEKKDKKDKKEKKDKDRTSKKMSKMTAGGSEDDDDDEDDDEDEKAVEYNDESITDMIERVKSVKDEPLDGFFEELRLLQIAAEIDSKMRFYVGISALFGTKEEFTVANVTNKSKHLDKMIKVAKPQLSTDDVLWGFEHLIAVHSPDYDKVFPMVCKALYDEECVQEEAFIQHYEKSLENPGFAEAKKVCQPFIEWLKTEDSDDSSEEESD